jgi:hypothetical protein
MTRYLSEQPEAPRNSKYKLDYDEFGNPILVERKKKRKREEGVLQKQVMQLLVYAGYFVVRLNSGTLGQQGARPYFAYTIAHNNSHAGMPDVIAMKNETTLFIECKSPTGRRSPKQIQCHADMRMCGVRHIYTVRTLDEVEKIIQEVNA